MKRASLVSQESVSDLPARRHGYVFVIIKSDKKGEEKNVSTYQFQCGWPNQSLCRIELNFKYFRDKLYVEMVFIVFNSIKIRIIWINEKNKWLQMKPRARVIRFKMPVRRVYVWMWLDRRVLRCRYARTNIIKMNKIPIFFPFTF